MSSLTKDSQKIFSACFVGMKNMTKDSQNAEESLPNVFSNKFSQGYMQS